MDRSPIKELTDRIIDLVSKRNVNNTILTAIAEVRVPSPSKTGMSHLQTLLVACECAACTNLHVYKWVCVPSPRLSSFLFCLFGSCDEMELSNEKLGGKHVHVKNSPSLPPSLPPIMGWTVYSSHHMASLRVLVEASHIFALQEGSFTGPI